MAREIERGDEEEAVGVMEIRGKITNTTGKHTQR